MVEPLNFINMYVVSFLKKFPPLNSLLSLKPWQNKKSQTFAGMLVFFILFLQQAAEILALIIWFLTCWYKLAWFEKNNEFQGNCCILWFLDKQTFFYKSHILLTLNFEVCTYNFLNVCPIFAGPHYGNSQNTSITKNAIHLFDNIKLILYPQVRNFITQLTLTQNLLTTVTSTSCVHINGVSSAKNTLGIAFWNGIFYLVNKFCIFAIWFTLFFDA